MARKVLLAVVLLGVVTWVAMCGRSGLDGASDTPVPTLTPLPTTAPIATQTATTESMPSPTEAVAVTATAVVTAATMAPITTTVLTESVAPTSTTAVVETSSITESAAATETPVLTTTSKIAPQVTVTGSTSISETALISESHPLTNTSMETMQREIALPISAGSEAGATVAVTVTPASGPGVTPPVGGTITASEASAVTSTVESTATLGLATPTPTAESAAALTTTGAMSNTVNNTATSTATAEASAAPAVSVTATVTGGDTGERVGETVHARQMITLPTQLATSVQVTGVTLLTDLVANALPTAAELSPDGKQVAWIVPAKARKEASLCVASVVGGGQNCFDATGFEGMPYRLVWSPDSRWIAFSEDPAAQAMESDIWLFDVAHSKLTNRTDDSVQGRFADATAAFALDYLPMWDPATGLLYFWRSTPDDEGNLSLDLMRLDPDDAGEAEVVRSLGQSLGDGLVRFGWQRFYLQGPSTIAPDGSRLAVLIAPAQEMDLSAKHALWVIDLENPQAEPQQLATALSWQSGLPQWSNQPAIGRGLQWTPDGKGIVVAALSSDLRLPLLLPYYVDVASGEVIPVVDFSDSTDRESFFRMDPATLHASRMEVPWTIAMAPNANVLLLVTDLAGGMRVWAAPLPPNGSEPVMVSEHMSPGFEVWTRSSGSTDGKVLIYGMLMQLTPN